MADVHENRIHYVMHFLKLSLWYVAQLVRREGVDFEDAVNRRVNIYRNTSFFDGKRHPARGHIDPEWQAYLVGLKALFERYGNSTDMAALEDAGLAYLWPRAEARMKRSRSGGPGPNRPYECWTFGEAPDRINIHIGNVYRPKSPLSEMRIPFAASLLRLLYDSLARRPNVDILRCGTWLNSMPPFQSLFPRSWHESGVVSSRSGFGMGHWGQFETRTGRFHERNGAILRETGDFPYASLRCQASIREVVAHLEQTLPEAVAYNAKQGYVPGGRG